MAFMIGRMLNHYRIAAELGEGGMGQVYLAEDTRLGRNVALKMLPPEMASDPDRRARLEREARIVAALNHPNIVTIHSVETSGSLNFITMELVEGKSLAELIPREGLPLARLLELGVPLVDAVGAAHRKGITHRDLKPGNVMVTGEGRVKVLDFGLAKLTDVTATALDGAAQDKTAAMGATREGMIVGTVAYMSPEQAEGRPVDARSDVFSLGILLYEMATGSRPFEGESAVSTIAAILRDTPRQVGELKPNLPQRLGRIVERCLAKAPDRRYQTALDIRNELEELKSEVASSKSDVQFQPAVAPRPKWRSAPVVMIVAALVMLAAAATLWPKLRGVIGSAPGSAARAEAKSIAVLPFTNMSGDPDNEYFSDGLAEELLNVLAKLKGLRVAARTSSFHFKGYTGDVAEIGRQLRVTTILEGSVRRSGDRVRVTAQLINAGDGLHLWSETYDRRLDDVFAMQEDIAAQVVGALKVTLLGGEAERLAKRPTESVAAYDAYLMGQHRLARRRSDAVVEAVDYFRKAIDLDPGFALAYVGLADANVGGRLYGNLEYDEAQSRARASIDKALALDSQLGEAYATLGTLQRFENLEAAEKAFERAIELNPSYARAYLEYGHFVGDAVQHDRALDLYGKALELDPLSPETNMSVANALMNLNRLEEALARYHRTIEIDPGFASAYVGIAYLYDEDRLDRPAESLSWYEKAVEIDPGHWYARFGLTEAYKSLGRLEDAVALGRSGIAAEATSDRVSFLASTYQYFGRFDDAIATVQEAIEANPQKAANLYSTLGYLYGSLGRLDDAVRTCHRAPQGDADSDVQALLAYLYMALEDETSGRRAWDRSLELTPYPFAALFEWDMHLRRGEIAESEAVVRKLGEKLSDWLEPKLWVYDMRAGHHEAAANLYARDFPRLFKDEEPRIHRKNVAAAIDIAASLLKSGDRRRGEALLRRCEAFLDAQPEGVRRANYRLEPVFVYALQGRKEDALAAFRRAVDQHWQWSEDLGGWRWVQLDPKIESIVGDPRFQAMMAEVRDDLAHQRALLAAEGLATP